MSSIPIDDIIVGQSAPAKELKKLIEVVAEAPTSVLVLGETGTGKELVARAIHTASRRSGKLVSVNCAAIPSELLESEIFGHEKGAFTGADKPREGRVELARGGTLFLDEIGDMPLPLQTKRCAYWKTAPFSGSAEMTKLRLIFGWSALPIRIFRHASITAPSAPTSITGSMSFRSRCRAWPSVRSISRLLPTPL